MSQRRTLRQNIDYTSKDYEAFRNDLINLIPYKMPEYSDYSQSDAGIMLIELLSYGMDILSYYQDRMANEVYLPTATQRQSVIDIVKSLGYRLSNATPSSSEVVFVLTEASTFGRVIPQGTPISTDGTSYEEPIQFETTQDLTIPSGAIGNEQDEEGNYLYSVPVVQGITIPQEIVGSSNGRPLQRFRLNYQDVIDGSVELEVNEGARFEVWNDVTNDPTGTTVDGKHYVRETDEDGFTWITFGDGLNGKIPVIGNDNIIATYRVGGGRDTNVGANTITVLLDNLAGIDRVFNPIPATGGLDRETIEQARVNAPRLFKSQDRAVTREDYEALALSVPGVAKSRAVPDEDREMNTVYVTIAPNGGGQPTPKLIQDVSQLIQDRKMITTQVFMETPKYVLGRVSLDVRLREQQSRAEIQTYVMESLKTIFDFQTREFGEGMPVSRIYQEIMNISGVHSVLINRTTIKPLIEWTQVSGNPNFENVDILEGSKYEGWWKVVLTSSTNFNVYQVDYATNNDEILTLKGSGQFGQEFTDTDNLIRFTITERPAEERVSCSAGDSWRFRTTPYLADIEVLRYEILLLDEEDLTVNMIGGRP